MNIKTKEESLLWQTLATVSLLSGLQNQDFLNSVYFEKMELSNMTFKEVLKKSTIGNPAALQMVLYALLVVPQEVLSKGKFSNLYIKMLKSNKLIDGLVEEAHSSYKSDKESINYVKHIRNAIAHSKCRYLTKNGKSFVAFTDKNINNRKEKCRILMETSNVGLVCDTLHNLILDFLIKTLIQNNESVRIQFT